VIITTTELWNLEETLEAVKTELEELVFEREWYVTDVIEQVEVALEICRTIKIRK
jgi:hypothetical protein